MAFGPTGSALAGLGVAGGIGATTARIDSLGEESPFFLSRTRDGAPVIR